MKYRETGFHALYHRVSVFDAKGLEDSIAGFPGADTANCVMVYGYVDRECGLTLEVLEAGRKDGDSFAFFGGREDVISKIRMESAVENEFWYLNGKDEVLLKKHTRKTEALKLYDADPDTEETRRYAFLDNLRHPFYPDDVQVILTKDGLQPEMCWVRLTKTGDHRFWGRLLNEPDQDFGAHEGNDITFFVRKDESTEQIFCVANFSPARKMKPEELEDGELLKAAIRKYRENPESDALFDVMQILRDSTVWIPCRAVLGPEDEAQLMDILEQAGDDLNSAAGQLFTSKQNIRMIPDILQHGDQYFFPVFSAESEMGEYGENFSKMRDHMLSALALARGNEKHPAGIVVNPFTEQFILPKELFDALESMESRIE